jgi:hypothetical protein
MFQSAQVVQLVQVSSTAETLAETVRNQVSPAAVQESEVAAVKAVNVHRTQSLRVVEVAAPTELHISTTAELESLTHVPLDIKRGVAAAVAAPEPLVITQCHREVEVAVLAVQVSRLRSLVQA